MLEFQYIAEQILIKQCGETLPRKKRESDFSIRVTPSRAWKEHRLQAEREVASLGIGRSSDAGVLFDAFVKRFSFIEMPASQGSPPSIQSIAKTNGGNPRELAFVLAHLFNWNDIEADVVAIYPDNVAGRPKKFTSVSCEHALGMCPRSSGTSTRPCALRNSSRNQAPNGSQRSPEFITEVSALSAKATMEMHSIGC